MLQVPFYLASLTLATALAGMHERRTLAFFTSCGLVAKVALSAALVPTFGVAGLLLAAALMYGIMSVIGLQSLKRHLHRAVL
jgi:Na+-driven multidrug efflux pump